MKLILLGGLEIFLEGTATLSLVFFHSPLLLSLPQFATDAFDRIVHSLNSGSGNIGGHFSAVFSLPDLELPHNSV